MIATSYLAFFRAAARIVLSCCCATTGRVALAGFLASLGASAFAQTNTTWTSPSDTTFATGANWDSGAPADDLTSHIAVFSTGSLASPVLTASQSVAGLRISTATTFSATNGASLTVGASNIAVSLTGTAVISAPLAGTASLTKSGLGVLTLSGANTYSGGTNFSTGTLNLAHASAVGSGTFTFSPTTLTLDNTSGGALTLATNNPLNFSGASSNLNFTGTNPLNLGTGAVTLSAATGIVIKTFTVSASTLTLGGDISGTAALRKLGNGTLVLNGVTSFAGGLTVSGGTATLNGASTRTGTNIVNTGATLNINHASALGTGSLAFTSNPKIDNTSGAAITLTTNNAQIWNSDFTFKGTNSLNLGTGAITMNGGSKQITVSGSTLTVGGAISDGGGITKLGAGTLVLGGDNLYNGPTAVNAGTLLVTGSLAAGAVTVNSGAKLGGTGTINGETTITSGGTLTPGDGPGRLTFASNVTLADGSISNFQINGTGRGTTFDAVDLSTGWLALGGTLNLDFGSLIAGGHTLDLFNLSEQGAGGSFSSVVASGSYSGVFTNTDGMWTLVSGLQTLTFDQTTGDLFTGTPVPEPSTYAALLGAAALGLAAWRRRTRPVA